MTSLLAEPLLLLFLTIAIYLAGVWLQRKTRSALANPTLIAIVLLGGALRLMHVPYATYFSGTSALNFLLGPATVALAVPMVLSIEHVRRGLIAMLAALCAGAVTGLGVGYGLVRLCGGERTLALSMMPKSVTTPIALGISQQIGGIAALSVVFAIAGGILAAVILPLVMRVCRVDEPAAVGLAAGTAGSGIGTSRVIPMGPVHAAFAGIAIGLNGLLTAILAPAFARWMSHL